MPLDDAVLYHAKRHHRVALEQLFSAMYGPVYRMAYALSGREDVGRGIVHFIMKQVPARMSTWRDADAAERWLQHHTVLTARRAAGYQPTSEQETLCREVARASRPLPSTATGETPVPHDPAYAAFVRALRALPIQQREAFILNLGEKMNPRSLAIAMDCSTQAAELHLKLATQAMQKLADPNFEAMKEKLVKAYHGLVPPADAYQPAVKRYAARSMWPRRVRRAALAMLLLAVAGLWMWWRHRR